VSRYREQIAAALRAVTVRGDTRYRWLGRTSRPLPARLRDALDASERRDYLVRCLGEELYASFYCLGRPVEARWGEPQPISADPWLVGAMSRANSGGFGWETGWTAERVDGGEVVVTSALLRARVPSGECRALAGSVAPGAAVSVRVPTEQPALAPGFFTVIGEVTAERTPVRGDVRVYWNVGREGAAPLVRALTSRLNAGGRPFRLKVVDHPSGFGRCDAAVLYLFADVFVDVRESLREVASEMRSGLRPEVPAFTLQLAPGVGLSENDPAAESFGVRRCALLAEGIVRAHERGLAPGDAQLEAVAARFAEDGVLVDAPYLEPSLAGRHVL
jgi:hypothetical protein